MKRGTTRHPKMYALAEALKIPLPHAIGIMDLLWEHAGQTTPQGDIGSLPDAVIAESVCWPAKKAGELVSALCEKRWLDRNDTHRLIIHDWPQHCEQVVVKILEYRKKDFLAVYCFPLEKRKKKSRHSLENLQRTDRDSLASREVLVLDVDEVLQSEKENPKVLAEDNAKLFAHFQQAYIETGKSMIAADFAKCRFDWDRLDGFQKLNAIAGVRARIEAGTAQYLPSPRNYILDSEWTRKPEQPRNGRPEPTPQQSEAYLKRFPLATGEKE